MDTLGILRTCSCAKCSSCCLNSTVCLHGCPPKGVHGDSLRRQALCKPVVVSLFAPQLRLELCFTAAQGIDKYTSANCTIHIYMRNINTVYTV